MELCVSITQGIKGFMERKKQTGKTSERDLKLTASLEETLTYVSLGV